MKMQLMLGGLIAILLACKPDEPVPDMPFAACCGTEPVSFSIGVGTMYIPNLITPNADGINDAFFVYGSEGIAALSQVAIYNRADSLIFSQTQVAPNSVLWDFQLGNGLNYTGSFRYEITVTDTAGLSQQIQGGACNFPCNTSASAIQAREDCRFPDQVNGQGEYDPNVPTNEVCL